MKAEQAEKYEKRIRKLEFSNAEMLIILEKVVARAEDVFPYIHADLINIKAFLRDDIETAREVIARAKGGA